MPLKDLQSFSRDDNVIHLAANVVFQGRSAFHNITFKINNCGIAGETSRRGEFHRLGNVKMSK